jgi:hypothetical protein
VVALSAIAWIMRNYLDRYFVILVAMFAIACAMARLPITGIHPVLRWAALLLLSLRSFWIAANI